MVGSSANGCWEQRKMLQLKSVGTSARNGDSVETSRSDRKVGG